MLSPNVTWGQLRESYIKDVEQGVVTSENPLHDPEFRELSTDKKNEDYVWPEEAKAYEEAVGSATDGLDEGEEPEAVTAAGEPQEEVEPQEEMEDDPMLSSFYYTVDDNDNVLELVRADDEGLFIRLEGKWVDISDEDEFPTVYEQNIHFANEHSVGVWDAEMEDKDDLKLKDIKEYIIK